MSLYLGSNKFKEVYLGSNKFKEVYLGSNKVYELTSYNPLNLPPFTIRLRYKAGVTPRFTKGTSVLIDTDNNIWDLTYNNPGWNDLVTVDRGLLEVIGANTTGITNMGGMLADCPSLTSVSLFDTSSVTNMEGMFQGCYLLTTVPLFNTSNVTNMDYMFYDCRNVQSGALALYQQASTQANPPSTHYQTFYACGSDTQTGAAELAQIPTDWGGLKT